MGARVLGGLRLAILEERISLGTLLCLGRWGLWPAISMAQW